MRPSRICARTRTETTLTSENCSDAHETFQKDTRPRRRSCRDLDRDVWYMKIIQHNKIRINGTGKLSKALCICNIVGFSALRNGKWSMFCCCTWWNLLLPVPTAEKKLWREDVANTYVYSYNRLQRGFLHLQQPFQLVTQTELSVIACH